MTDLVFHKVFLLVILGFSTVAAFIKPTETPETVTIPKKSTECRKPFIACLQWKDTVYRGLHYEIQLCDDSTNLFIFKPIDK